MAGNANSGRRPQPTALRVLRGNPGKRRIRPEPHPPAVTEAFDTPPPELAGNAEADKEWRRLAPLLRGCRLVTEAERTVLLVLCQQYAIYLESEAKLRRLVLPDDLQLAKFYRITMNDAQSAWLRLCVEVGLTPTGRTKIHAIPGDEEPERSKWDGLLSSVKL